MATAQKAPVETVNIPIASQCVSHKITIRAHQRHRQTKVISFIFRHFQL